MQLERGPYLEEISYSQDATVAAITDFYQFLVATHVRPSDIVCPPVGGWPSITTETMKPLGKTDVVVELLRHLPYVTRGYDSWVEFANWDRNIRELGSSETYTAEDLRWSTETHITENVPAHVIGIASGENRDPKFLLDKKLGVIYWPECFGKLTHYEGTNPFKAVEDDPYEWAEEDEADWRSEAECWEIGTFFEMLKEQYREQKFVPLSPDCTMDVFVGFMREEDAEVIAMAQEISREHGWPDLARYRKDECLHAMRKAIQERFPEKYMRYDD